MKSTNQPQLQGCGQNVMAVIVSYNGEEKTVQVIQQLRHQVGCIYVVDNGSSELSLAPLKILFEEGVIDLYQVNTNMGIGYALNKGIEKASEFGFEWLLTMDQDSLPDMNMVETMIDYQSRRPQVKCLSPNMKSSCIKEGQPKSGAVSYAITSGNLVNLSVFSIAGKYDETLFIDYVDFDFSLKVRKQGLEIHKVPDALMQHCVGEAHPIPKIFTGFYTQHSSIRRYYMFRNYIFLVREYLFFDVRILTKLFIGQAIFLTLMLIYEKNRLENIFCIIRGVVDGMNDRRGVYGIGK